MVDRLVNSEANARRIAMVENCFGASGQPLNVPGRVLVGEGVLTKMCRKKPKPRQFFLFNDILVYGNIVLNKKKYNKQHIIPLEEVQLSSLEDDGQFRNGWLIKTPTKSFAVYAATATEKAEWMAHINKCVTDLLRKSGKKAAETHAAVWVPDSETQVCMHCKKSQFTLINRRHHCRKCGRVVCGPCSSKKVILSHQSNKPLRVCLTCHDELSSAQSSTGGITPNITMAGRMVDIYALSDDEAFSNIYDLKEPVSDGDEEEDMKERNDSSGDDDSEDDMDEPMSPQSPTETMTFYEGGEASNGEAPSMLDASASSTVENSSVPDSPADVSTNSTAPEP
ncbi:pleckstrin homology domain-containing family F member 2-like isoform X5 [Macrobrachium nipponense]|uniref:pleckstrin homology domain-containing family F member 2-like isoform X5 n=1 Tax=Macrobrachium nipponense TaxID=159736 RepID=UPI0030C8565B